MELKIFTPEYANDLAYKVEENLSKYKTGCFNLPKGVEVPSHIVVPDDLLEKMLPYAVSGAQEEYNAAIALYEAFKDLTPLQASYKPFWLHLSHVELMDYMVARWPAVKDDSITDEKRIKVVNAHWFHTSTIRNQLEGLYWLVRCSVIKKEDGTLDYTYTKFLFSRTKLGNRGVGASFLFRNPKAVKGILRFYIDNEETLLTPAFEDKTDHCIQLLNGKGAVTELSLWEEDDFYNFLESRRDEIGAILDRKVQKRLDEENAALEDEDEDE